MQKPDFFYLYRRFSLIIGFGLFFPLISMSQSNYHLVCPNGRTFDFQVLETDELTVALDSDEWKSSAKLSEIWQVEIFMNNAGHVLQVLSRSTIGFILKSEDDLQFFNSKMVPHLTAEKHFCPFLLIKKEDIANILEGGDLERIGTATVGGITEIYLMPDQRIFTVDDRHTFGEIYLSLEDFMHVERDFFGSTPIVTVPRIIPSTGTNPASSDD